MDAVVVLKFNTQNPDDIEKKIIRKFENFKDVLQFLIFYPLPVLKKIIRTKSSILH